MIKNKNINLFSRERLVIKMKKMHLRQLNLRNYMSPRIE